MWLKRPWTWRTLPKSWSRAVNTCSSLCIMKHSRLAHDIFQCHRDPCNSANRLDLLYPQRFITSKLLEITKMKLRSGVDENTCKGLGIFLGQGHSVTCVRRLRAKTLDLSAVFALNHLRWFFRCVQPTSEVSIVITGILNDALTKPRVESAIFLRDNPVVMVSPSFTQVFCSTFCLAVQPLH